jgi:hypothetical protein
MEDDIERHILNDKPRLEQVRILFHFLLLDCLQNID